MGKEDLEMIGESVMKHPEKWAKITGIPLEEMEDMVAQCKECRCICRYKFNMMYDVDCCIQAGLYDTFMRGAGMIVTDESFDAFIGSIVFEWWEENILPSRKRIMTMLFGEYTYDVYEEISFDEHWK